MQIGLREEFEYMECGNCGCLQLVNVPSNMEKFYSFNYGPHQQKVNMNFLKIFLLFEILKYYYTNKSILGNIFSHWPTVVPDIFGTVWKSYVDTGNINKNSSILDVGCGSGFFLLNLKKLGYNNLYGIDLFIDEEDIPYDLNIIQVALDDYKPNKKFDVITAHHSFEHMDKPFLNLECFKNLLKDEGLLFIRIPVKTDYIWNKYGVNWYQIDAPRHIYLYTVNSFKILATKCGFDIEDIIFDSTYAQFISSEQYVEDTSMDDDFYYYKLFDYNMKYFKNKTIKLNNSKQGDQAIFVLRKK